MNKHGVTLLVVLCGAAACAAGDIGLFRWAKAPRTTTLTMALSAWLIGIGLFAIFLRRSTTSFTTAFVVVTIAQTLLVVGYDVCFERYRPTWPEVLGVVLAIAGVTLLECSSTRASEG